MLPIFIRKETKRRKSTHLGDLNLGYHCESPDCRQEILSSCLCASLDGRARSRVQPDSQRDLSPSSLRHSLRPREKPRSQLGRYSGCQMLNVIGLERFDLLKTFSLLWIQELPIMFFYKSMTGSGNKYCRAMVLKWPSSFPLNRKLERTLHETGIGFCVITDGRFTASLHWRPCPCSKTTEYRMFYLYSKLHAVTWEAFSSHSIPHHNNSM